MADASVLAVVTVTVAVPMRPSASSVVIARPLASASIVVDASEPRLVTRLICVPGLSGLPSGRKPVTVIVELPLRPICVGLTLTCSTVPGGATGLELSQAISASSAQTKRAASSGRRENTRLGCEYRISVGVYGGGRVGV
ncbi:MAG: hypothetical protein AAF899_16835 [Pseudomonadota bacterium]